MDLIVHNWTEAGFSTHGTSEYDPLVGLFVFFGFGQGSMRIICREDFSIGSIWFSCVRLLVFLLFYL